jgi:hypothetical protein
MNQEKFIEDVLKTILSATDENDTLQFRWWGNIFCLAKTNLKKHN